MYGFGRVSLVQVQGGVCCGPDQVTSDSIRAHGLYGLVRARGAILCGPGQSGRREIVVWSRWSVINNLVQM